LVWVFDDGAVLTFIKTSSDLTSPKGFTKEYDGKRKKEIEVRNVKMMKYKKKKINKQDN
tara:strand:- start:71 stop:247 length:177 start_codon:yes stop_codon:yes gene_type:complete